MIVNLSANVPTGINGYALVLTKKLKSFGTAGKRHFDQKDLI